MIYKILEHTNNFIFKSNPYFLFFCLLSIMIVKTGIWMSPNMGAFASIAENPFINKFLNEPLFHYMIYSWLSAILVYISPLEGITGYFISHLAFSFLFCFIFFFKAKISLSNRNFRISLLIFFLLPASATSFYWVGLDGLTLVLLMLLIVWHKYFSASLAISFLLGMQHFEQGIIAISILLLCSCIGNLVEEDTPYSNKFCLVSIIGILLGKLFLTLIFIYNGIEINSGRIFWFLNQYKAIFNSFILHFNFILWSSLGLGWYVFIKYIEYKKQNWLPFGLSLIIGMFLIPLLAADQTRSIAIVSFLLIAFYWLLNEDFLNKFSNKESVYIFLVWLVIPWMFLWGGHPQKSVFIHDVVYSVNNIASKVNSDFRVQLEAYG